MDKTTYLAFCVSLLISVERTNPFGWRSSFRRDVPKQFRQRLEFKLLSRDWTKESNCTTAYYSTHMRTLESPKSLPVLAWEYRACVKWGNLGLLGVRGG